MLRESTQQLLHSNVSIEAPKVMVDGLNVPVNIDVTTSMEILGK